MHKEIKSPRRLPVRSYMSHMAKLINQRMISLWKAFVEFADKKTESIPVASFKKMLEAMDLQLNKEEFQGLLVEMTGSSEEKDIRY